MSRFKLIMVSILATVAASMADVSVMFNNDNPKATNPWAENTPGTVTLDFSVDGSGNVTLDASCSEINATIIAEVDKFDGPVGTVSYAGAFSTNFSIEVVSVGGVLRLSEEDLGGFGVSGQNQWRIDRTDIESVKATASGLSGTSIDFKSVDWTSRANANSIMQITGPQGIYTNALPASDGTWDLDAENIFVNDGKDISFLNATTNLGDGYVLSGFSFDVVQEIPDPGITVSFANTNAPTSAPFAENSPGTITLDYTVDAIGFVTVDASCSATDPTIVATVDEWDGAAGYVDFTNSVSFSVEVAAGSGTLRVSDFGGGSPGGLGITGENQWKIDNNGIDYVKATLSSLPGVALQIKTVEWYNGNGATMELDASNGITTNELPSNGGTWSLAGEEVYANNGDDLDFGNATTIQGYTLVGFEFNLVSEYVAPPVPGVDVEFSYADANMNFGTGGSLSLDFSINGSGVVSLDASTSNTNAAQIAAANAWDSSDVGFITNSALFSKTFSLVGTAQTETGAGAISMWSNDGGILGVVGQSAGRIDGANVPTGTNNLESLIWTMSGDVTVDFTAFAHGNTHPAAGIKLMDSDTTQLLDLAALGTPVDLTGLGFSVGAGQSLSFNADTNFLDGAGIAGFSFDISASQALNYADWATQYSVVGGMTDDDDNDGLGNLYEFAVGGNPTNGTVAPAYMPTSTLVDVGGSSNVIEYVYTRRQPVPVDLQYYCEVDTQGLTFPNWTNDGYSVTGEANAAAGFKTVTNQIPVDANTKKFIKLVIEQQ